MVVLTMNCAWDMFTPPLLPGAVVEVECLRWSSLESPCLRPCFHGGGGEAGDVLFCPQCAHRRSARIAAVRAPPQCGPGARIAAVCVVPQCAKPQSPRDTRTLYARPARAAGGSVVVLNPWEFSVGAGVRPPRGARRRRENSGSGAGEVAEVPGMFARLGGGGRGGAAHPSQLRCILMMPLLARSAHSAREPVLFKYGAESSIGAV
jgi:hypothetical protein